MNLIFLDIDGVLFTRASGERYARSVGDGRAGGFDEDLVAAFDADAVRHLCLVIRESNAQVVVSSTWRQRISLPRMRLLLEAVGIAPVLDITGPSRPTRAREIFEWLQAQPAPTGLVVIDDVDDELTDFFPDHFVKCDSLIGFDEAASKAAATILQRPALGRLGPKPKPAAHAPLTVRAADPSGFDFPPPSKFRRPN